MAKAPRKLKERRLTKAQVGFLDKAEVRKICLLGMGLDTKRSYELSPAEMVTWMVENQAAFLDVDLPACDTTKKLRPGVIDYMVEVQRYLRNERDDCPAWNHDATPESPHDVSAESSEPAEAHPLTTVMDEDDEEEPAELVEFPETEITPTAPAAQENKMEKPAFKTGMTTPPPFFRKTVSPVATHVPEPDPAPLAAQAAPTPQGSQTVGIDPDELQALIEMVSDVAGVTRDLPAALADLKDHTTTRMDDLKSGLDVRGLHKKVDSLGVEVRELAAAVQHLHNGVALLVNIWRPMGVPYSSLADVPEPAAYLDDVAAE